MPTTKLGNATLSAVREAAEHYEIALELDGDSAVVTTPAGQFTRPWFTLPLGEADAPTFAHNAGLILSDYIDERTASHLRSLGYWYLDAAGNAFVRAPGAHIDVRGRRRPSSRSHHGSRRAAPANLMSAKRAQVVFAILSWPQLLQHSVRNIAKIAGTSLAQTHLTLSMLEEAGFLVPGHPLISRRSELVDTWTASYPLGLGRSIELGRFIGDPDPLPWRDFGHVVHVSGEWPVAELSSNDLTLYVDELDPQVIRRLRWRSTTSREADSLIIVRRRFWHDPEAARRPDVVLAPELLIYADLMASGESRQMEVARADWRSRLV